MVPLHIVVQDSQILGFRFGVHMSKAGKCYCLGRCAEQGNVHSRVIFTDIVVYVLLKSNQLSLCCIQTLIKI